MIVWKYSDPIEKYVYITNTEVTIIEPELEQAIVTKLQKEINILKLLKNAEKITNNTYRSEAYNNIYILSIKNNQLTQIKYKDEIDNKITIKFDNIKQNEDIANAIFKYHIPFEYDVIRK